MTAQTTHNASPPAADAPASDPDPALRGRIAELEQELTQAAADLRSERRRAALDRALAAAGALDLETARLLCEHQPDADVTEVVRELRRRKPFLFASPQGSARRQSAMSPLAPPARAETLEDLAEQAKRSGDRGTLLRYLKTRRAG